MSDVANSDARKPPLAGACWPLLTVSLLYKGALGEPIPLQLKLLKSLGIRSHAGSIPAPST